MVKATTQQFLEIDRIREGVIILKNFLSYSVASKIYLWRKKRVSPKLIFEKKVEIGKEEIEKAPLLKITEKSRLKDLSTQIETRTK